MPVAMVKSISRCSTAGVDRVLKAAERRLAGQGVILRQAVGDHLEDRIVAQRVVIIAVLVAGEDAEQTAGAASDARC